VETKFSYQVKFGVLPKVYKAKQMISKIKESEFMTKVKNDLGEMDEPCMIGHEVHHYSDGDDESHHHHNHADIWDPTKIFINHQGTFY
jgi:hypothetical protein